MVQIRARVDGEAVRVPLLWIGDESRAPADGEIAVVDPRAFAESPAMMFREYLNRGEPPAEALTERVAEEAMASHPVLGDSPETWSPLGSTDPERAYGVLEGLRSALQETGEMWFDVDYDDGWLVTAVRAPEAGIDAVTLYSPDAFVAVLPPGATDAEIDLSADVGRGSPFVHQAVSVAMSQGWGMPWHDDGEVGLDWRTYVGDGTAVTDSTETIDPYDSRVEVRMSPGERASYLVGRLFHRAAKSTFTGTRDPSRSVRLALHTRALPRVAAVAPELTHADATDRAVVVVHGTMGCAIPLAETVLDVVGNAGIDVPVLRYEHDTWRPLWDSAWDLAEGVRALGATSVLLVGHSRGGIVAQEAGTLLHDGGTTVRALTLGAPFGGTPVIGLVERGRRGLTAALAALRASTGPVVDVLSRAVLRELRHQLPEGIRDMHLTSSYLGRLRAAPGPPCVSVAGAVDPTGRSGDSWGARGHFFRGLFGGPNDRVVDVGSALAAHGAQPVHVRCDHSSYTREAEVRTQIAALAAQV